MGGTEYVSFELFLGILSGPGEGRGGAPGTVPLQNPEVTSRKACLRNAYLFGAEKPMTARDVTGFCAFFLRANFREGDEDSNLSIFRVRRFSEWPEPLH